MMENVKILVFVSYGCYRKKRNNRIWLENGKIKSFGKPKDIIKRLFKSQS